MRRAYVDSCLFIYWVEQAAPRAEAALRLPSAPSSRAPVTTSPPKQDGTARRDHLSGSVGAAYVTQSDSVTGRSHGGILDGSC